MKEWIFLMEPLLQLREYIKKGSVQAFGLRFRMKWKTKTLNQIFSNNFSYFLLFLQLLLLLLPHFPNSGYIWLYFK